MVEALGARLVGADVVRGPADAEVLAARRELADEVGEVAVVRIAAGLGAQHRDGVVGGALPVEEEAPGPRVEEDEPAVVGRPAGREVHLGVEGEAEPVGGEDVQAAVLHERRRAGHRVEDALHARPDALLGGGTAAPARRRPGGTGEVEQVRALGLVELRGHGRAPRARSRRRRAGCRAPSSCSSRRSRRRASPPPRGAARGRAGCRRRPAGRPACGVILARREVRNSRISSRGSTTPRVDQAASRVGGTASTWIKRDSHFASNRCFIGGCT